MWNVQYSLTLKLYWSEKLANCHFSEVIVDSLIVDSLLKANDVCLRCASWIEVFLRFQDYSNWHLQCNIFLCKVRDIILSHLSTLSQPDWYCKYFGSKLSFQGVLVINFTTRLTTAVLIGCSILTTSKQFFGDPIHCNLDTKHLSLKVSSPCGSLAFQSVITRQWLHFLA